MHPTFWSRLLLIKLQKSSFLSRKWIEGCNNYIMLVLFASVSVYVRAWERKRQKEELDAKANVTKWKWKCICVHLQIQKKLSRKAFASILPEGVCRINTGFIVKRNEAMALDEGIRWWPSETKRNLVFAYTHTHTPVRLALKHSSPQSAERDT